MRRNSTSCGRAISVPQAKAAASRARPRKAAAAAGADEVHAGGHQRGRQGDAGDEVVEIEMREVETGGGPAGRRRPGGLGPQAPAPRQPVEGERRQQQVEPEMGVEGPERRADEKEEVVR